MIGQTLVALAIVAAPWVVVLTPLYVGVIRWARRRLAEAELGPLRPAPSARLARKERQLAADMRSLAATRGTRS